MKQMRRDGRLVQGEVGAVVPMDEEGLNFGALYNLWWDDEVFYDDLSGEQLNTE